MHDHTTIPEEWRPVVGYEGWYEVSNFGRVRRVRAGKGTSAGKILIQSLAGGGYPFVVLSRRGVTRQAYIHTLVAEAFIPKRIEVNHIDSDKSHNCSANLEWVTPSENHRHRVVRVAPFRDSRYLTTEQVRRVRELLPTMSRKDIADELGISPLRVSRIATGRNWAHVV